MHHLVYFQKWCGWFINGRQRGWHGGIEAVQYIPPALLLFISLSASAVEFSITIADIAAPAFSARGIRLALPADGSADLRIANLQVQQYKFHDVHIRCANFMFSSAQVSCRSGRLDAVPGAILEFSYGFAARRLQFDLSATGGELWQMEGQFGERAWQVSAQLR